MIFFFIVYLIFDLKISNAEANKVRAPMDVDIIAKIINPPICAKGIIVDKSNAPNAILDQASKMIG
jgi:hypothetical protein